MGAGVANGVCQGVGAFNCGNYTLKSAEQEEGFHGFVVSYGFVLYPALIVEESMLRANGGIVQTTCNGVYRQGLSLFILQQIAFKAMKHAGLAKGYGCGVVTNSAASAHGFYAHYINGVCKERYKHANGV